MIYTDMVREASKIMLDAHKNDVDKGGYPYVMHPIHIAQAMESQSEVCVALLHDVVQDHEDMYTMDDIVSYGFSDEVVQALRCMTHAKDQPYWDYIERVKTNSIATAVKIQDLKHNLDSSRINGVVRPKNAIYVKALEYLNS